MKKSALIIVVFLILVLAIFLFIFFQEKPAEKENFENQESGNEEQDFEPASDGITGALIGGDNGAGSSGTGDTGGTGGDSGDGGEESETEELPSDLYTVECGFYFEEHGICAGICPEGNCMQEGRSCYCRTV